MGLRSGLRTWDELTEQSYCQRRAFYTIELGRLVQTSWTFVSGNSYSTPLAEVFDGVPLEIGSLTTQGGDWLTRVDTAALCGTTSSSYFFSPASSASGTGTLYVNLPSSGNPNNTALEVGFWKLFGSSGTVEPLLGVEKATDPSIENWTDGSTPASWVPFNIIGAGGVVIFRDAVNVTHGTYSARISPAGAGLTAATNGGLTQGGLSAAVGFVHHMVFRYRTSPDLPPEGEARIRVRHAVAPAALYMGLDGRHTNGTVDGHTLKATGGEWHFGLFAFIHPSNGSAAVQLAVMLHNTGGGALSRGSVNFELISLKAVYRYEYAEARLPLAGVPSQEVSNNDIFMGSESVGLGSLKLLNTDHPDPTITRGYLEALLDAYDVNGRLAQGWLGGGFDDGQEIPFDVCQPGFRGTIQSFSVDDLGATLDLQDTRTLLGTEVPVENIGRRYAGQPGVSDDDSGRPVPILIGAPKYNMKPPRVALGLTNRLPIWLVNDPTFGTGSDIMGQVNAWAYTDEDAANRRDTTRRVPCEFTSDNLTGLVSLFSNPGPFEVLGDSTSADVVREVKPNDYLDYIDNGVTKAVALTPGLYTCTTLCAHEQAQMNAAGGGTFTVAYSNLTHAVSFTKTGGAGNFSLNLNTGANKHRSAFPLNGFSGNADLTGAAGYTGAALYDETRADQFLIRIDATGYRDDAAGTFTGITGGGDAAIIYQGPDVLRFLLVKVLKRPLTEIDDTTFNAFRVVGRLAHVLYLGGFGPSQRLTLQQIVDRIEVTCHTDIVMDGQGKWFWKQRQVSASDVTTAAANAPVLTDRDYIEFASRKSVEDTYAAVSMTYDEHPVTGVVKSREASNANVEIRHKRAGTRVFEGWWFDASDAQAQGWNLMLLAVQPRRMYEFTCKGRLQGKTVGDLIKVQRTRKLGPELAGMVNEDVARILSIGLDPQTHIVRCVAYTADLPRNSDAVSFPVLRPARGAAWAPTLWSVPLRREVKGVGPGLL